MLAVGIQVQQSVADTRVDGDDVPQVHGNKVDDDEIDLVTSVVGFPSRGFHAVAGFGKALGGFDLDAPEVVSGVEDKVVALAVAPGFGDAKAEGGSLGEEGGLRHFALAFAGGETDGLDLGYACWDADATGTNDYFAATGAHKKKAQCAISIRLRSGLGPFKSANDGGTRDAPE